MLAFLRKYREILRFEWDNLKSNPANVCRRHNRHSFITEWVFRHVATCKLGSGGVRGAEVQELCHLSGLFTECTVGAAGEEHISSAAG